MEVVRALLLLFLCPSKAFAAMEEMNDVIMVPPSQFQVEQEYPNTRTFHLCFKMCVEKGNDTSCNKDIHLNETSGNCQLGLAQGTIPSVKMDTLIKVYKSSQTPAMAAPVEHFYLSNHNYSWDYSLNLTESPAHIIPQFHGSYMRPVGWFYNGGLLMCGTSPDGVCNYFYLQSGKSRQVNGWPDQRFDPAFTLYQGQPWVLGGFLGVGQANTTSSTLVLTKMGEWLAGPNLPHNIGGACAVALNDDMTKFLIVGGQNSTHWKTNQSYSCQAPCSTWTFAGSILGSARRSIRCHKVKLSTGEEVVVAAGGLGSSNKPSNEVDIYSISGGSGWRVGPTLPKPMGLSTLAVIGGKLFIMGGQKSVTEITNSLYEMLPDATGWVKPSYIPQLPSEADQLVAITYI